ncbi:MAG: formimidoylglutamase [Thioclava sp.]|nr:formimidoylglutamase [Thioclava sp.]|tara:strand:+ start:1894 stop:2853 length:960 start_codon:yes stop_codon:yes gene_type:complete
MSHFASPPTSVFFSKSDAQDPRLGEVFAFHETPLLDKGLALLGYPDDDGVKANGGRIGASQGPDQIRHWLYRMVTPENLQAQEKQNIKLMDLGNLNRFESLSLKERHLNGFLKMKEALTLGHRGLSFGGGHDYGYPDGKAFLESLDENAKPLILNFDAHLDVRPPNPENHSGTPFYRLRSEFLNFEMIQIGIQNQCNSKAHLKWCNENNIQILSLDAIWNSSQSLVDLFKNQFSQALTKDRPTFVSIDIDGFSWSYAPGCSQSWPTGLEPRDFFPLYDFLLQHLDVRLTSIYEVAPPLDVENGTSKLAAQIAYRFLRSL